jgi:membrane protein implicated in regulation of membrane protease activity
MSAQFGVGFIVIIPQFISSQPAHFLWLLSGFVFLALGTVVGEPVTASLGIAAIITAIAALTVSSIAIQVVIWGVLSISLAVVLRGMVPGPSKTLVPKSEATVSQTIPRGGIGWVSYEGGQWKARCQMSDVAIAAGQTVQVIGRQGLTLIVLPMPFSDPVDRYWEH